MDFFTLLHLYLNIIEVRKNSYLEFGLRFTVPVFVEGESQSKEFDADLSEPELDNEPFFL